MHFNSATRHRGASEAWKPSTTLELAATGATVRFAAAIDLLAQAEIVEVLVVLPDVLAWPPGPTLTAHQGSSITST